MKVLISCLSKSWGGMEMYALTSLLQLQKKGISTELLCLKDSRLYKEAEKLGINTFVLNSSGYLNLPEILNVSRKIKHGDFDIIHTHASKDLWKLTPALKFANSETSLILTKHVGSFIKKKDLLHKWLYGRVTCALAISNVIKQNLIDTTPLADNKIILHHDGIDISKFDPSKTKPLEIRKEFNIKENEIVIGMMARFSPGKGHEEFLHAAKNLSNKYDNLKFMIVGEPSMGEDDYGKKIKELAEDPRLRNRVIFTGFRKDTPDVLSSMDIFAFPSHAEALGMALIEAMAMEKPSVCSNSDGVLDIALEGITSYLFEKQNGNDLSAKLELLIESPVKRKEFGKAARKRVINNFELEALTGELIQIYKDKITVH